jgi:hypothetical protein
LAQIGPVPRQFGKGVEARLVWRARQKRAEQRIPLGAKTIFFG